MLTYPETPERHKGVINRLLQMVTEGAEYVRYIFVDCPTGRKEAIYIYINCTFRATRLGHRPVLGVEDHSVANARRSTEGR